MTCEDAGRGTWDERLCRAALRWWRRHLLLFSLCIGLLHALNIWQGAPWWAFWPGLIWGVALSLHYFLYKSLTIDESWVDERIDDLREKSYDIAHLDDLEDRIRADDHSTRPAHRRDPEWWRERPPDDEDKPR